MPNKRINNNNRNNNRNNRKRRNNTNNNRPRVVRPFMSVRPDHSVVVKHVQFFSDNEINSSYFACHNNVKPYQMLANSSYAPLLNIYESLRVTKIVAQVWLGGVSMTTPGYTACMYFRDVLTVLPQRFAEQLICEPGHKQGRPTTKFTVTWLPIEPTDYEFYDHSQAANMDNNRYGQLNFAGASFPSEVTKPIIQFTIWYDFKSLVKPEAPPTI